MPFWSFIGWYLYPFINNLDRARFPEVLHTQVLHSRASNFSTRACLAQLRSLTTVGCWLPLTIAVCSILLPPTTAGCSRHVCSIVSWALTWTGAFVEVSQCELWLQCWTGQGFLRQVSQCARAMNFDLNVEGAFVELLGQLYPIGLSQRTDDCKQVLQVNP